jgi:pyruvate,orthophosphate dikinase
MPSKALEINLASSHVDVTISGRYDVLQEVMSRYRGIKEGLNAFLKELCHPFKNWRFIVKEARGYALDYFHLLKTHPKGPETAKLIVDIFLEAIDNSQDMDLKGDAGDNLLLYLQKIIKDSGEELPRFLSALEYGFDKIRRYEDEDFHIFVKSYYQINRLAKGLLERAPSENSFGPINMLLSKYLQSSYTNWIGEEDPFAWFTKEAEPRFGHSRGLKAIFSPVSHEQLRAYQNELESAVREKKQDSEALLARLILLPGYSQIVDIYREIPRKLLKAGEDEGQGNNWKLIFFFHIMDNTGECAAIDPKDLYHPQGEYPTISQHSPQLCSEHGEGDLQDR